MPQTLLLEKLNDDISVKNKYQESEDRVVGEGDDVGHEPEVRLVVPVEEVVGGNVLVALFGFPGTYSTKKKCYICKNFKKTIN